LKKKPAVIDRRYSNIPVAQEGLCD
jgi:hypothetical protein